MSADRIRDRCPTCRCSTLFVSPEGFLTCSSIECNEPGVSRAIAALRARLAEETARAERAEARAKALEEVGRSVVNALYRRVVHMGAECWRYDVAYEPGVGNPVEAFRRLLAGEGK